MKFHGSKTNTEVRNKQFWLCQRYFCDCENQNKLKAADDVCQPNLTMYEENLWNIWPFEGVTSTSLVYHPNVTKYIQYEAGVPRGPDRASLFVTYSRLITESSSHLTRLFLRFPSDTYLSLFPLFYILNQK